MDELTKLSDRLVVMSANGAELLREVHRVPEHKIDLIPHGIPQLPARNRSKDKLGVDGKSVLLTFGLLSPDKGIEHVIDALPAILERYPDTLYIVLGATHPHVKERHGETYRLMLESRAKRLGVESSIIFHNRFVSHAELVEFLSATDIYITPYLKAEQITSGTLAYAVGSGKAVISTPYRYARELLADGRGVLVPWKDSTAIAEQVVDLLGDEAKRHALQERAAAYGLGMTWPVVARGYVQSLERARTEQKSRLRTAFQAMTLAKRPADLPEINLEHLRLMTDETGILQHATFSVPRYEDGYCLDDNARALLLIALIEDAGAEPMEALRALGSRYLAFVSHAFDPARGRFKNFMSYSREWIEACGSEDSHGRALWALGTLIGRSSDPGRQNLGGYIFHGAMPAVLEFSSPRAWAYTLLGIDEYLRAFQGDSNVQAIGKALAEKLLGLLLRTRQPDWPWFESRLTYCNARLAQALIASGAWMGRDEMKAAGLQSLDWLVSVQWSSDGYFAPIGSNGFYVRGESKAAFDQQPVEAYSMLSACLEAHRVTEDGAWATHARREFSWFLGENQLQQSLYDPTTGGCRDGLHADRINQNQGAESTLSFLMALLEMRSIDRMSVTRSRMSQKLELHRLPAKELAV
jgi:hypothetical protein